MGMGMDMHMDMWVDVQAHVRARALMAALVARAQDRVHAGTWTHHTVDGRRTPIPSDGCLDPGPFSGDDAQRTQRTAITIWAIVKAYIVMAAERTQRTAIST